MEEKLAIFDFNRTIYDPEKKEIMNGVIEVLESLLELKVQIILISRDEGVRRKMIKNFKLEKYFFKIFWVQNKDEKLFRQIFDQYKTFKIYVVGDYLYDEIYLGNIIGAKTIWLKKGRFSKLEIRNKLEKPKYVIGSICEVIAIVKNN